MARMSKMDYQLHCRMQDMFQPGVSRHQSKQDYKDMMGTNKTHNRTIGIHSYKTYDAYKQTSIEFSRYMKDNHKDIKDISDVKQEHVIDYLKYRQKNEISSYSISKDMAALNKLFNYNVTKKMANLQSRTYKNITRSRGQKAHDRKYNPNNYADQIAFAKSCGCRRESILIVTPERFTWKNGLPVKVFLKEKGGKPRHATILKDYQKQLKTILDNKEKDKPLFEKYTKKIDNHAFRREYAQNRYKEILGTRPDQKNYRGYSSEVKLLER